MDHNKFQRRFNRQTNLFDIMFGVITAFIAVVFICIIAFYVMTGIFVYKAADQVQQHGIKSVAESIWCGKNGCKE